MNNNDINTIRLSQDKLKDAINSNKALKGAASINASYYKRLQKQQKEAIERITMSTLVSKSANNMLRESYTAFAESINALTPSLQVATQLSSRLATIYSELIPKIPPINIPHIEIPKIEIPPGLIDAFKRYKYLSLYCRADWPLFLIDNEELRLAMDPFIDAEELEPEALTEAITAYIDRVGIETISNQWNDYAFIEDDRMRILLEAIQLYNQGYYYGCTSILMCQIAGIISSSYNGLLGDGKEPNVRGIRLLYQSYNDGKELNTGTENKIVSGDKRAPEKQLLLCMLADVDSGLLYWKAAVDYLYNIVFTSDNDKDKHACRNKICHGIQLNYGDKEHALKAVLSIDLAIKLANYYYESEESDMQTDSDS